MKNAIIGTLILLFGAFFSLREKDQPISPVNGGAVLTETALIEKAEPINDQEVRSVLDRSRGLSDWQSAIMERNKLLQDVPESDYAISETTNNLSHLSEGYEGFSDLTYLEGGDWNEIFDVIAPLVPFIGDESLDFERKSAAGHHKYVTYIFTQKINGIEVRGKKLYIKIDKTTRRVMNVDSILMSDRSLPTPLIGAAEAIQLVTYKMNDAGLTLGDVTYPKLLYVQVPGQGRLKLIWRLGFARVDAISGDVQFLPTLR